MLDGEEHWNAVLAAILVSPRVGTAHIKLVGDLLSVTAQLDMAVLRRQVVLDLDSQIEYDERIGALEDSYRAAWQALQAAPDKERRNEELRRLAAALEATATAVADFARRQGVEVRLHRVEFDGPPA
ncbi:hypothetical protein AB0O91_33815 [Kitasatospora sp. NPDC089797]|uniref:hypothetical protein n=1 Tax=Kitasatospora sp. NPDC089797 TaxID=3155298 RepID=UPI003433702C